MSKTGMAYYFMISRQRADGTGKTRRRARVLALSTSGAWREIGAYVHRSMRGPRGRMVTAVELQRATQ
jgi:hypothetical protein